MCKDQRGVLLTSKEAMCNFKMLFMIYVDSLCLASAPCRFSYVLQNEPYIKRIHCDLLSGQKLYYVTQYKTLISLITTFTW